MHRHTRANMHGAFIIAHCSTPVTVWSVRSDYGTGRSKICALYNQQHQYTMKLGFYPSRMNAKAERGGSYEYHGSSAIAVIRRICHNRFKCLSNPEFVKVLLRARTKTRPQAKREARKTITLKCCTESHISACKSITKSNTIPAECARACDCVPYCMPHATH